jgi:uncharacterized protein (DUF433 family)
METAQRDLLHRITVDSAVLVGKPVIRGLRISVEQILRALAAGVPKDDLLADYPELEEEDLQAVLAYAADRVAEEQVFPVSSTEDEAR